MGQALLEEKTQLEDSTVEEVTFDFSLKARSELLWAFSPLTLSNSQIYSKTNVVVILTTTSPSLPIIDSEHGKSVFLLLSKIKAVPCLEAQKDMIKWLLQVGNCTTLLYLSKVVHVFTLVFFTYCFPLRCLKLSSAWERSPVQQLLWVWRQQSQKR